MLSAINNISSALLYPIMGIPATIIFILFSSLFLTLKLRFINFSLIPTAIKVLITPDEKSPQNGKKNKEQVSPMSAFLTQAAGNLGIGNIAGAAFALNAAGPGVVFWIIASAFMFSIIKFCEITLGHHFRNISKNNIVSGGCFYFISSAFSATKFSKFAKYVAFFTAVATIFMALGWSSLQVNQVVRILADGRELKGEDGSLNHLVILLTFILVLVVFLILSGGIKRISELANKVVPTMAGGYMLTCAAIMIKNSERLGLTFNLILEEAFNTNSIYGGLGYVVMVAMQRMIFASEAGVATGAIVHSTSNTKYSARQGLIAICDCVLIALIISMGAVAILASGVDFTSETKTGVMLISQAFCTIGLGFKYVLMLIVFLFGFTTIVANGYYVQKGMGYIFGTASEKFYVATYTFTIFAFSLYSSKILLSLADTSALIIVIPNLICVLLLSGKVKQLLLEYNSSIKVIKK